MNAIDELINEHTAVKMTLKILQHISQEIDKTGKISNPEHLEQLFDFFATFVDQCHHGKEEELLFPALEQVGVSREGGPVGVMLKEHQRGRELVAQMKTAIDQYLNGDHHALARFQQRASDYVTLLDFHIDKENQVLYPMAVKHLPENNLAELQKGFDRIETDRIGAGKHEAYHKMLDVMKETYLN